MSTKDFKNDVVETGVETVVETGVETGVEIVVETGVKTVISVGFGSEILSKSWMPSGSGSTFE